MCTAKVGWILPNIWNPTNCVRFAEPWFEKQHRSGWGRKIIMWPGFRARHQRKSQIRVCCCKSGSWVVKAASKCAWQFITDCCWYVKPRKTLCENKSIIGKLGTWLTWDNKMQLPLGSPAETSPSPQSCLANIKNAYFITQTDGARSPVTSSGNLNVCSQAWLPGGTRHGAAAERWKGAPAAPRLCWDAPVAETEQSAGYEQEPTEENCSRGHKLPHDRTK